MGVILGLLSMFGWGLADFLAAISSRKIGYILTYFWTQIASLFIALAYFVVKFPTFQIENIPRFLIFLLPAGFLFMVATLAFYKGLTGGQVSLVSPIGSSWAIVTVILSMIFFKEILYINQIIAIILIILGIILVSINIKELLKIKRIAVFAGTKEGLIAMIGWGLSLFLIIPASKALGWFLPVFILKLSGILFLLSYLIFGRQSIKTKFQSPLLVILFLIGFFDMIAFFGYSLGVAGEYASVVTPVAASFPVVTIILAKAFFKEKLVLNQVFGIVSVIAGLILISI